MKIEKRFTVHAPLEDVWRFITAPQQAAACIPGCQAVEVLGASRYKATIKVQVGPIKTTFNVDVEATEQRPPGYFAYVTTGEEGGRASRIRAESTLALKPVNDNDQETEVQYTSDINIVGRLGKFGLGMMKKKADSLGDEFVANLCERLEGRSGAPAAPVAADAGPARMVKSVFVFLIGLAVMLAVLWFYLNQL